MRIAVLTGLLACAIIFVSQSGTASALSLEQIQNQQDTSIELLLAVADKSEIDVNETEQTPEKVVVEHIVEINQSLSDIAKIHNTTWKKLYDKNTAIVNPDVINVGDSIIIPAADETVEPRELPGASVAVASQQSPSSSTSVNAQSKVTTSTRGTASGNRYVAGYCTWYVKNQRPDLPNNLGNAATWVSRAAAQGMATGSTPRAGAVGQRGNHVVYVESVNADNTVTISEMNHKGLYVQTTRTLPASYFTYIY